MQILKLHVLPGAYKATDFANMAEVETLAGYKLAVATGGGAVTFTGPDGGSSATVTEADMLSCGGVVHELDAVLVPGVPSDPAAQDAMPAADDGSGEAPETVRIG